MTDTPQARQPSSGRPAGDVGRRRLILGSAALTLAGCASISPVEHPPSKPGDDSALLDNVLAVEYQAIAAYEAVLAGGLLAGAERDLAASFQADHVKHSEVIAGAITRAGGTPAEHSPDDRPFAATELHGRDDALRFLVGIEQGVALAHLSAVPAFASKGFAKGSAGICSVESMHWAIWRDALGEAPVPEPIIG